jgi:hypothetical protein
MSLVWPKKRGGACCSKGCLFGRFGVVGIEIQVRDTSLDKFVSCIESQRMDKLSSDSKAGELFAWGCKKRTIQVLHDFKDIKVDALHGNYRQACVLSEVRLGGGWGHNQLTYRDA